MRIEFDPTNRDEATAVRAVLDAMYGPSASWSSGFEDGQKYWAEENEAVVKMAGQEPTDSTGTPWDERIHSNPPTQNKDGTWRAKRGVTADVVAQVKAEREQHEANALAADGHIGEAEQLLSDQVAEAFAGLTDKPVEYVEGPDSAPTTAPKAPTPPAPPSPTDAPSFLDVMKAITAAQKDGKIDTAKVKELCAAVGAGDSTMGLNGPDNGDKRGAFMALLGEVVS